MRRGVTFSKRAYILLAFTALFNLLSIVFDQLVVQQEDKIRDFDHTINEKKQEVFSNLYAHRVFNDLMFKVHFNSADLIGDLNYLTKAINFLNSDISKKINVNKEDEIKKQYINKVKDIFIKYKQIKQNTLLIFNKINDDKIFIKFINKERPPNDLRNAYKDLERAKNNIKKKAKKDYLIKYNFNAKTEEEQNLNYNHYVKLYDELNAFNYLKNNFEDLADDFKIEFSKNFSVYFTLIDRYAELNITKNYFILLSILFQIIGLVSLIILFRVLVIENK